MTRGCASSVRCRRGDRVRGISAVRGRVRPRRGGGGESRAHAWGFSTPYVRLVFFKDACARTRRQGAMTMPSCPPCSTIKASPPTTTHACVSQKMIRALGNPYSMYARQFKCSSTALGVKSAQLELENACPRRPRHCMRHRWVQLLTMTAVLPWRAAL